MKLLKLLWYTFLYILTSNIAPYIWKECVFPDNAGELSDRLIHVLLLLTSVYITLPWWLSKVNNSSYKESHRQLIEGFKNTFTFKTPKKEND